MKSAVPSGEMSQSAFKNIPPFDLEGPYSLQTPPQLPGRPWGLLTIPRLVSFPPPILFFFSILRLRNQNDSAQQIKSEKKNTQHF